MPAIFLYRKESISIWRLVYDTFLRRPTKNISHFAVSLIGIAVLCAFLGLSPDSVAAVTASSSASLDQAANGRRSAPVSPVTWQNGNVNENNSHYQEGESVPYRLVITGLTNGPHVAVIEWDIRNSDRHAIDFLTQYDRIEETVNPLAGLSGTFGPAVRFAIPPPIPSLPVIGVAQPQTAFNAMGGDAAMTIYNGFIAGLEYVNNSDGNIGDLTASQSASDLVIRFVATNSTVVLAWGGHIASREDWGIGNSAGGISGSPYHTRLISVDGNGGNQDRSLKATAVCVPPTNAIGGPLQVCAGSLNSYTSLGNGAAFAWSVSGDATLVGSATNRSVLVQAGSGAGYILTVTAFTAAGANACSSAASNAVIINPLPLCAIFGPAPVCPFSTNNVYSAPPGMSAYSWSIAGNGSIIGATNEGSVTVAAGSCGQSFSLKLELTDTNGCFNSCTSEFLVTDTSPPSFSSFPPNSVVECPGDTSPNSTGIAIGTDNCGVFSLEFLDSVLEGSCSNQVVRVITRRWAVVDYCNNRFSQDQVITVKDTTPPTFTSFPVDLTLECPGNTAPEFTGQPTATDTCSTVSVTYSDVVVEGNCSNKVVRTINRTWKATDACGNITSQEQIITIRDTTPPVFASFPVDSTIECPGSTAPEFTGQPVATDTCSTVSVEYSDLVVEGNCSNKVVRTITRTWKATDACGNNASREQIITVRDTTPPVFVSFPTNSVVECPNSTEPDVTGQPTATDTCNSVAISYSDRSIRGNCTNHVVETIIRTWTATDACDNKTSQDQVIELQDLTAPQIVCPSDLILAEAAGLGGAIATFDLPGASDTCDSNPQVIAVPESGSFFPVGTNIVEITATDACSNSTSCTFSIRVIGNRLQVNSTADAGPGSLREALMDANELPDPNLINFNFPGEGPFVIHLQSALPVITNPIFLDGWSQSPSGFSPTIALDGSTAGNPIDGLVVAAGNSTVRGLVLFGFRNALILEGDGHNVVQGNFIGTDFSGTNIIGNSGSGIYVNCSSNLIGGTVSGTGNVIAGNQRNGVTITAVAGLGNALFGNSIFANGVLGIDLGDDGVTVEGSETGPNHSQPFPTITGAVCIDGTTTIGVALTGQPFSTYRIEFFLSDVPDPSGYGAGQTFIGASNVKLDGSGTGLFQVAFQVTATFNQFVTATATDARGNSSEFSQAVQVQTPPSIDTQPSGVSSVPGQPATFCANVSGTPPIIYQWRLNGINIPGATDRCYTIPAPQLAEAGTYTVLVGNAFGAIASLPVTLTLTNVSTVPAGDNFADRVTLTGTSSLVSGDNSGVTVLVSGDNRGAAVETGEPLHAGKAGGASVWYTWRAPVTGVVRLRTSGSTFNTLLAVYTGTSLTNLAPVASDQNHGGFYTSETRFNAFQGAQYHFAIDGFGGAVGEFLLSLQEEDTSHLLPIFLSQPVSQTVAPGQNVTFTALGARVCGNGKINCDDPHPQLFYQWYFFGSPIPGATNNQVTINNVQPPLLGNYTVRIATQWQTNESSEAILQINQTGEVTERVQAADLFLDSASSTPLVLGAFGAGLIGESVPAGQANAVMAVISGYTGSQIFNTGGSGATPTETICGVIGGASMWITLVPQSSGTLYLSTDGSSYDTVMAAFRRSPTGSSLQFIMCDNNSGTNGRTSVVSYPVTAGVTNYIDIDGVNGATGILQLNYSLITPTTLSLLGATSSGCRLLVSGRPAMRFTIQASTNLVSWTPLLVTNSVSGTFEFIDSTGPSKPQKFYRALLLP